MPLPWLSGSAMGSGGGEIGDFPLLHPSEDGKRRLWGEERGWDTPRTPGHLPCPPAGAAGNLSRGTGANHSPPGGHRLQNFSGWVDYFGHWGLFEHPGKVVRVWGGKGRPSLTHTSHPHASRYSFLTPPDQSVSHRDTITAPGSHSQVLSLSQPRAYTSTFFCPAVGSGPSSQQVHLPGSVQAEVWKILGKVLRELNKGNHSSSSLEDPRKKFQGDLNRGNIWKIIGNVLGEFNKRNHPTRGLGDPRKSPRGI